MFDARTFTVEAATLLVMPPARNVIGAHIMLATSAIWLPLRPAFIVLMETGFSARKSVRRLQLYTEGSITKRATWCYPKLSCADCSLAILPVTCPASNNCSPSFPLFEEAHCS